MIGTEWHGVRRAALVLTLVMLSGCSDYMLPKEDSPAMGPDPSYRTMIANYIKVSMKSSASYDAFEISDPRWVNSIRGWDWLVCVRFRDHGHRRTYAFFVPKSPANLGPADSRYAVMSDGCDTQIYSPFDLINSMGPLY
jgi:hypothetical protein